MRTIFNLYLFLVFSSSLSHAVDNYQALKRQVEAYLKTPNKTPRLNGLVNSNKIGLGYNPHVSSPVCFTGDCQADGFRRPVFDLTYSSFANGSCVSELIPEHVSLDCIPSATSSTTTELISTLEQLKEITSSGVDVSIRLPGVGKLTSFSFGYKYSQQTRRMVDSIVLKSESAFFSTHTVTYVKLSLYDLTANLSNHFKYVIDNLPCCNESDPDVADYVNSYIFDYFGYAYVIELVLGGRAQTLVTMKTSDVSQLEALGINTKHEANLKFLFFLKLAGVTITNTQNTAQQQKFQSKIQKEKGAKLGGDPSISDIAEWTKSVPNNPVVVKFGVKFIFDLIRSDRFPSDPQIDEKARIILYHLDKYLVAPPICYQNCSGHGNCTPTDVFGVGNCTCDRGYTGVDCSIKVPLLPSGTICGWATNPGSTNDVLCQGFHPLAGCPPGYARYLSPSGKEALCYTIEASYDLAKAGTYCGGAKVVRCGSDDPSAGCPSGYQTIQQNSFCVKTSMQQMDATGTWCGYFSATYNMNVPCNGVPPGQCPTDYEWRTFLGNRDSSCIRKP